MEKSISYVVAFYQNTKYVILQKEYDFSILEKFQIMLSEYNYHLRLFSMHPHEIVLNDSH